MTTLIVPCAGKSSRFKNTRPKYLLTYPDGEIMVKKSISGVNLSVFDRVIITVVQEHCNLYESDIILKQSFGIGEGCNVELCILPEFTSCQSETIYQTIKAMGVVGDFIIKDSDNFISLKNIPKGNFIIGLDLENFKKEVFRLNSKSFLLVNEQDIVTDIIEKKIKSDHICVGMYGFADADEFCESYLDLIEDFNYSESTEVYISHVISFMIGVRSTIFKYYCACDFEDWGTPRDWQAVRDSRKTYFIDLDGVVFLNRGKYGSKNWYNDNDPLNDNVLTIKELYDAGAQIVITTARGDEFKEFICEFFKEAGVELHAVVTGCNHSSRVIINDFAPSNAYPSCLAISIPRDGIIRDYINL